MTRLVGVRAVCDGCSAAAAIIFCVAHRTVLCSNCDASQHATAETATHQRVDLESAVTALPFCEYCDDAPATTYCESEGTTLCDKCDRVVHSSHPLAHYRTPISSTLRNRAVEFRGKSRHKTTRKTQAPQLNPANPSKSGQPAQSQPRPSSSSPSPSPISSTPSPSSANPQPSSASPPPPPPPPPPTPRPPSAPAPAPSGTNAPQQGPSRRPPAPAAPPRPAVLRKRSSKVLAKRKQKRDAAKQVAQPSATVPESTLGAVRGADLVVSNEYSNALFPMASSPSSDIHTPAAPLPYASFPMDIAPSPQGLHDPLLMDSGMPFRAPSQDRQSCADNAPGYGQDLSHMISYGTIDFSGDTALEGFNEGGRSGSGSGASSRRKTPDFDAISRDPRFLHDRGPASAPATSVAAVTAAAAAAAAAAGEMYLLNSVSSGRASSQERFSPPLNDAGGVPDPAGVAAAATAAAAAAAESAVARGADMRDASSMQRGILSSRTSDMASRAPTHALQRSTSWEGRARRIVRRISEPIMQAASVNPASGQHSFLSQRPLDELQKLELEGDNNSQAIKSETRGESSLNQTDHELLTSQGESNTEFLPSMQDSDDVLRRGPEGIGDLDMPRDDFGVFGSIDLSQFEQNTTGSSGLHLSDYRPKEMDSDDG